VLAGVFSPEDESGAVEQTETDIRVVLPWKEVSGSDLGFGAWLDRLRLCVETLSGALADRFGLSVGDVTAVGWQQVCPRLLYTDTCYLTRCLADPRKGVHHPGETLGLGYSALGFVVVTSAERMTSGLLQLIVRAGAGFCA
jgi:hypothetical protein